MGTNYYFRSKKAYQEYLDKKEKIQKLMDQMKQITDVEYTLGTIQIKLEGDIENRLSEGEIHIGKNQWDGNLY